METKYTMLGADGQQYGPVGLDLLKSWIREGRIDAASQILRSDTNTWLPASQYTELGLTPPAISVSGTPPRLGNTVASFDNPDLVRQMKNGAGWFYWIAGFSLFNSLMEMTSSPVRFILGFVMTSRFERVGYHLAGQPGAMAFALAVGALLVVIGVFANKGQTWAFILGTLLYAIDTYMSFSYYSILTFGFHVFVIFGIIRGLMANLRLRGASEIVNG